MALLHIILFLIHAIAMAFASMMTSVLTHLVPMVLLAAAVIAAIVFVCTSCGIGGAAFVRRRRQRR